MPKLPDINHDQCLKSAAILCFTETWLTQQQASPTLFHHQIALRCDRMSGQNTGGVLIKVVS